MQSEICQSLWNTSIHLLRRTRPFLSNTCCFNIQFLNFHSGCEYLFIWTILTYCYVYLNCNNLMLQHGIFRYNNLLKRLRVSECKQVWRIIGLEVRAHARIQLKIKYLSSPHICSKQLFRFSGKLCHQLVQHVYLKQLIKSLKNFEETINSLVSYPI